MLYLTLLVAENLVVQWDVVGNVFEFCADEFPPNEFCAFFALN